MLKNQLARRWTVALVSCVLLLSFGTVAGFAGAPEFRDRLPQSDHPVVKAVLSDDKVTDSEMREVLVTFVECVESEGFKVTGARFWPGDGWDWNIVSSRNPNQEALVGECEQVTVDPIGPLYLKSVAPSDAEREAEVHRLVACMGKRGVDAGTLDDNNLDTLLRSAPLDTYVHCVDELTERAHPSVEIPTKP